MIYCDYNATTPVDPRVLEAMLPLFSEDFANASSGHTAGRAVARLVEQARGQVAALVGAGRRNVVFTSGATEAANLAIRGVLAGAEPGRRRILVAATEHKAVLAAAQDAARIHGGSVGLIRVLRNGTPDLDHLASLLSRNVVLVAVMAANSETGAIADVRRACQLTHSAGALYLCDVTQAAGKIPVALEAQEIDLAVLSAHKIYGPKGVGALVASRPLQNRMTPLIVGGGQERGLRSGTVNSAGIVGFGRAAAIAAAELATDADRLRHLTALLHRLLAEKLTGVELNGPTVTRLPNTLNLRFAGADADAVMTSTPQVAVSAGSACKGSSTEPSHVLTAMGLDSTAVLESLRFSLGRPTTEDEVHTAADHVVTAVDHVRSLHHRSRPSSRAHTPTRTRA
ncbi:cysteine desulfurase family protein [Protofrankia symbiont of Coriaria ruscifolia]|uniref:cysteine desulfurase family protein n=1 Tax=Protofrankia symbiont of Coriaria ruscifolia TaxID=1306542 RepID=UPI0013EFAAF4|nr:cysteine desulfurase family protein [Protofrankia symbiont of Coriaria ruscifolia]